MRRRLGIVLLAWGLAFLVVGTGGFDHAMADRTAGIEVADDPEAYLGIVDNSDDPAADVDGANDTGTVFFLDDNANAFSGASGFSGAVLRIDYDDATTDTDPGLAATIRDADDVEGSTTSRDYVVYLECEDGATDQGTGYVTVRITATGAASVDAQRTTNQRTTIDCT